MHREVKSEKRFLIRRPGGAIDLKRKRGKDVGEWVFGQTVRVIYRWHEIAARPGELVVVCEGEKNADAIAKLGLVQFRFRERLR